ncbi:MAG TPA: neutral/alkaline non-lysosomal ceramidase N-terminal domain-containing protein [Gemmataceae bacterium]|nr:neutral/alkaline non-lysosomal ceramidase N-terminal domain-containing protein [Gemmataceae bacterium]
MRFLLSSIVACLILASSRAAEPAYQAGVASVNITPSEFIWMAGYGSRNKPAEGKQHDLFAKAVALQDAGGKRLVIVTTDLVGLPRSLTTPAAVEIEKKTSLPRECLMFTSSHTHCGPVIRDNLADMYDITPEMREKIAKYTDELQNKLVQVVTEAVHDLKPAVLHTGKGTGRFAVNRRQVTPNGVINGNNPGGPVDHDVPVLRVSTPEGKLRAVIFGYACHNTTLQFYHWCGDYAGFAQLEIQQKHPEATALFFMGCGADANPLPRSTVELCKKYGHELASAAEDVLKSDKLMPVLGRFTARYGEIELPFDAIPTRDQWTADLLSKNFAQRTRAARFIQQLDEGRKIDDHYRHYPVQVWKLGDLIWIALGGEVVVDYSYRLKRELGSDHTIWVTGYANDVMAYIPSLRVLKEGGYEADSSMIYYGLPSKWGPSIEEKIVAKVKELAK